MNVSVLMPYHNRLSLLAKTLDSYVRFYKSAPPEIVLINDTSDQDQCPIPLLRRSGLPFIYRYVDRSSQWPRNPATLFNMAADSATREVFMLTNPECYHAGPLCQIGLAPAEDDHYVVFGCRPLTVLGEIDTAIYEGWYQHSIHANRLLHEASMIHADLWPRFDEDYDGGYGYDDHDFAERILERKIKVKTVDEPWCSHQWHERPNPESVAVAKERNRALFESKWGHAEGRVFP